MLQFAHCVDSIALVHMWWQMDSCKLPLYTCCQCWIIVCSVFMLASWHILHRNVTPSRRRIRVRTTIAHHLHSMCCSLMSFQSSATLVTFQFFYMWVRFKMCLKTCFAIRRKRMSCMMCACSMFCIEVCLPYSITVIYSCVVL